MTQSSQVSGSPGKPGRFNEEARTALAKHESSAAQVLRHLDLYDAKTALAKYYAARAVSAASPADAHAFYGLAAALQPSEDHVEHDPRIPREYARLASIATDSPTSDAQWAIEKTKEMAAQAADSEKQEVLWKWLEEPVLLPPLPAKSLRGDFDPESLKAQRLLINLWATWCPPCQQALPLLEKVAWLAEEIPGVKVISLNGDSDQGAVRPYLDKRGLSFPLVLFGEEYHRELATGVHKDVIEFAWPQTWLVDQEGYTLAIMVGFDAKVEPDRWVAETISFLEAPTR
ncbi:MAG: TlpA family protein disulfide reductase, partial [Thermoanaerobaculia bacterium]|nr:TlpA family protein disulfide reductase [Thermoanaerobaculia bacterium]